MNGLRDLFLLDPDVVFLNHGSFGATPRPVFEVYQEWQRRLERQPVQFIGRELRDHLQAAREALAGYLGAGPADLVFLPNATFGVNLVARSLKLRSGDQVLASDHEYGACDKAWRFLGRQTGAEYLRQPIPLPVSSADEIVEAFWAGVTPRTRVIFLSHIASPTALCLPVAEICRRARAAGILTLIDGAHAPGQIPLDPAAIGADFYVGNCHKWLMSAKGAGFLHTRPERQPLVEPLVVSWGWENEGGPTAGSAYLDGLQWWGTKDPAAYLSVPAAIRFQAEHDWPAVRRRCHALLTEAVGRISGLTGLAPLYPDGVGLYHQMAAVPLPPVADLAGLREHLYQEHRVEVPLIDWNGRPFVRISVQGYNTAEDVDALVGALKVLLSKG